MTKEDDFENSKTLNKKIRRNASFFVIRQIKWHGFLINNARNIGSLIKLYITTTKEKK